MTSGHNAHPLYTFTDHDILLHFSQSYLYSTTIYSNINGIYQLFFILCAAIVRCTKCFPKYNTRACTGYQRFLCSWLRFRLPHNYVKNSRINMINRKTPGITAIPAAEYRVCIIFTFSNHIEILHSIFCIAFNNLPGSSPKTK